MLLAGKTPAEAAHAVGVARQTAYTWKAVLDEGGIDALRAMPTRGRPARLDESQPQALGRTLLQSEYFSPSWTAFQADRGRDFSVIVDGVSG